MHQIEGLCWREAQLFSPAHAQNEGSDGGARKRGTGIQGRTNGALISLLFFIAGSSSKSFVCAFQLTFYCLRIN